MAAMVAHAAELRALASCLSDSSASISCQINNGLLQLATRHERKKPRAAWNCWRAASGTGSAVERAEDKYHSQQDSDDE